MASIWINWIKIKKNLNNFSKSFIWYFKSNTIVRGNYFQVKILTVNIVSVTIFLIIINSNDRNLWTVFKKRITKNHINDTRLNQNKKLSESETLRDWWNETKGWMNIKNLFIEQYLKRSHRQLDPIDEFADFGIYTRMVPFGASISPAGDTL